MKIVFVTEFFPKTENGELRGGAESRLFSILQHLAQQHDITVLSSYEIGMMRESTMFGKVRVLRCGPPREFAQAGSLISRFLFSRAVYRTLRTLSGDILDAQNFVSYVPAWLARKKFHKVVITVHDVWRSRWVTLFGLPGIIGELYERYVLSRAWDSYIANSHMTKEQLVVAGVQQSKIRVIYNGIQKRYLEMPLGQDTASEASITYVGRLVEYKRVQDLLHAVANLKNDFPSIRLHIVGVGPYEKPLQMLTAELGLSQRVIFHGHIAKFDDVMAIIARSQVFSLPSIIEGFGMVTVEAMALGVPFVNADIRVTREVTDSKGGLFFTPKDHHDCARQLKRVLSDAALADRLRREGRERAHMFLWEHIAEQTESVYQELCMA